MSYSTPRDCTRHMSEHSEWPGRHDKEHDKSGTLAITPGTRPQGSPIVSRALLTSGDSSCTLVPNSALLNVPNEHHQCAESPAPDSTRRLAGPLDLPTSQTGMSTFLHSPANLVLAMCFLYASKNTLALPLATLKRYSVPSFAQSGASSGHYSHQRLAQPVGDA